MIPQISRRVYKSATQQDGAILILLTVFLALISIFYAINLTTGVEYRAQMELKTGKALLEAKEAILGWSVSQNNPGQLPCPEDTTLIGGVNEGAALSSCDSPLPVIGRLPWKTLGIGDIRDGNNDKLWYVISPGYQIPPINTDITTALNVDGTTNIIAIVFSPGVALSSQNRQALSISQYLDLSNNDGDFAFISNSTSSQFNDRLITISKNELFKLVTKRVFADLKGNDTQGLVKYYGAKNSYPYADGDNDGKFDSHLFNGTPTYQGTGQNLFFTSTTKSYLFDNGWFRLTNYDLAPDKLSVTLTLNGNTLVVKP